jgi:hypothetical protein
MAEDTTTDTRLGVQDLTADERQSLEESGNFTMLAHAESGNLTALRALSGWLKARRNLSIEAEAKASAETAQATIAASPPEQHSMLGWFGFPTDLTRCTPFFPLNRRALAVSEDLHRDFLRDFLITSAAWGEIRYTGPRLSTYEEDALMILLAVLDAASSHRQETESDDGRRTYTYAGPALPLLQMAGYKKPSKRDYARFVSSLKLMTVAGLDMRLSGGKSKKGKQRNNRESRMSAILAYVGWKDDNENLEVTVNPYFYEMYCTGRVTLLEIAKRMALKSPIAKALYRFVQSHRSGRCFEGHVLTLIDVLNVNRNQPMTELRRTIKLAISALKKNGTLTTKSKFVSQDIVILDRADTALPSPKKESKKVK